MHMNLSVTLIAKQNTRIITYILRMAKLYMGLFKSSGAHRRICCLKLFRLLLVRLSIRNPSTFGKVIHHLTLRIFPFFWYACFMLRMFLLMFAPLSPCQNPFWQQHVNFSVYMARKRESNFHEASFFGGRTIFCFVNTSNRFWLLLATH